MAKIKEGYVMSVTERAEYERQDALPRKTSGRVDYFFKPQTKFPPRIYVFMDAELWRARNRRPMGLFNAVPFLSRPMNRAEIEYHHFNWRLCYHQYEDWDKLIYAEEQEAAELDEEEPGSGTAFLDALKSKQEQFPLADKRVKKTVPVPAAESGVCITTLILDSCEEAVLAGLVKNGNSFTAQSIATAMEIEQGGYNRKAVLIALKQLYRNTVLEEPQKRVLTLEGIKRRAELSEAGTRRNFVRRVYRHNKLFALTEIIQRYPDYTEAMLLKDLKVKSKKQKRKKHKPIIDLRRCQLEKLATKLCFQELSEQEYHAVCCKMAMLQHAHNKRLPIPLAVKLGGETLVYSFGWKIREQVVKSFVDLANSAGMTHEQLKTKYQEITSSAYSY